jgi:hypothetical protein
MPSEIAAAIERYAAGAEVPLACLAGLTAEDLLAKPVPGTWSIAEIVVHLADSDLTGSDRMKRVIAMDKPLLLAFDETRFAQRLHYQAQDARVAAELFRLNRRLTAAILRQLPEEAFARQGVHTEAGLISLRELVVNFADHLDGHINHLRTKRELLGKPLPS